MGAGTSAEQVAEKPNEEQDEQIKDLGQQEQDGQEAEVDAGGDAKLLHTNGKIAIMNGTEDEEVAVEAGVQDADINGQREEVVVIEDVEQQEPASVTLDGEPEENMGVVHNDTTRKDNAKEDGQVESPEATDTTPVSEEKESPDQSEENESNEVGFKKVFKFVGFKFTVKKDKTEKSEPVQLLTVKKDEGGVNGIDNPEEHIVAADEGKTETQQETKDIDQQAESADGPAEAPESPSETSDENQKKEEEAEVEKDQSPTNPVVTETSSPFKRFFTQGWAGLRKKTSFKKSKEEDPQEVEKCIKGEEQEKTEAPEAVKEEEAADKETTGDQPETEKLSKSASEESKVSIVENIQIVAEEEPKPEESSTSSSSGLSDEETVKAGEGVVSVPENTESVPEIVTSNALSEIKAEGDNLESKLENQRAEEITAVSSPTVEEIKESLPLVTSEAGALESEQSQLTSSTECAELEKSQEVITTEADLLSSQEKAKVQGSPLKKLFSSSGLRKLSGKKSKGKKEEDTKIEVTTEPVPVSSESPEAPEVNGGDSSPSSPDESAETSPTEKTLEDAPHAADAEGEGTTSDGERKKDGITPWASFKKLVTPKRRPKRPSESDKEDEVEKVKSSTMSSTDSAGSVENQEETKENGEEQKLEKSTEENKKKVDSSVSWEALICVGSSKKRARKTSDSDEEEIQKSHEESKKSEEVVEAKEIDSESPITSSQEQQVQESPSPDQTSSPTEADGVSTWQSFKRLVTPRRKSRTRVEDKTEENAVVVSAEQSASEGEAGKEESWVSLKKFIPGRKKKKSDGKQEHTSTNEAGEPVNDAAEDDDYDEPAVVPLSEFDAAEQEKLDAQKSLEESVPIDVSGDHQGALEKPSEELIHAVIVTVIEGERAVTSLEERSPSWISAKVTESVEHAKKTAETTDRITTEVTVEETVVFSTVSQVMTETQTTLINEMELTSEALTALEEAIENSCAEETTEMVSAVSQLGESVVSTEEATPVPEEDASMQNLDEQKKHTDSILQAAAEMAKLSIVAVESNKNSTDIITDIPQNLQYEISGDILGLQEPMCLQTKVEVAENEMTKFLETRTEECNTILTKAICLDSAKENDTNECVSISADGEIGPNIVEELVERVILPSTENLIECVPTSDKSVPVKAIERVCEPASCVKEETNDSASACGEDQDRKSAPVSAEEAIDDKIEVHAEVAPLLTEEQTEEATTIFAAVSAEEVPKVAFLVSNVEESKEGGPVSAQEQAEEAVSVSAQEQAEEAVSVSAQEQAEEAVSVSAQEQAEEAVPVSAEVQAEEAVPVSAEVQAEEAVPVSAEVQAEETVPVSAEVQADETVPVSAEVQAEETVLVSAEVQAEETVPVSAEVQAEETVPVSAEVQAEETVPVSAEVQAEEAVPVSAEVQAEEAVPVSAEVQAEEAVPVSAEVQAEEAVPVSAEVQAEEAVPVSAEVQAEEAVPVSAEVQAEEAVPVSAEVQAEEAVPVSAEVQAEEAVPVSSEVQAEEAVPVSSEVQAEEAVPVSSDVQAEEAAPVPSEVQAEEAAPVPSEVQAGEAAPVPSEVQAEEAAPVPSEVQAEEAAPVPSEVQAEEAAPVPSEVQAEEAAPVPSEVQAEEAAPVPSEVQAEEAAPVPSEVQAEEAAPVPSKVQAEVAPVSDKIHEDVPVSAGILAEECVPVSDQMHTEEVVSASELRVEEYVFVVPEVQSEISISEMPVEEVPVSAEIQSDNVSAADRLQAVPSVTVDNIDLAKGSEECTMEEHIKDGAGALKSVMKVDQLTLGHEEVAEVKEEVATTDIPEFESSEASKASEPVTAAAVEEQVLAETVKPIETTGDCINLIQVADNTTSEYNEVTSEGLQKVVESVSQKAAAIVDAAIEAATNCFVVDAASHGDTLEEATVTENGDPTTEETLVQTISIESHSTTIVQNIIEAALEKVVGIVHDNESVSIQGQNLENELVSQVQETVPLFEPIRVVNATAYREHQDVAGVDDSQKEVFVIRMELQTKGNAKEDITSAIQKNKASGVLEDEESTQTAQNPKEESKHCVPTSVQEENINEIPTQADSSEVNAQEKAQTVES